ISGTASALRKGRLLRRHPGIVGRGGLDGLEVTADPPVPYQVDGDHLGEAGHFDIAYEPDVLTIVVP
ncbi:MAG: diacylglycerol kinase family lipid kinase, partial [Acidimicrobiia bacterium]